MSAFPVQLMLRSRKDDIPLRAERAIAQISGKLAKEAPRVTHQTGRSLGLRSALPFLPPCEAGQGRERRAAVGATDSIVTGN